MSFWTFALSCYEILKISYLTEVSTDWPIWLMPSDKHNSITAQAMGLISSLFNVALSRDVPFHQPLQLQYLHHGSTKAYLSSPFLSPLLHWWQYALALLHGFMEDLVTAVIAEVFNTLSLCSTKCWTAMKMKRNCPFAFSLWSWGRTLSQVNILQCHMVARDTFHALLCL